MTPTITNPSTPTRRMMEGWDDLKINMPVFLTGVTGTFAGMSAENSSVRWDKRVRLVDAVRALFVDVDGLSRGFR